jgi:hypothetical protein
VVVALMGRLALWRSRWSSSAMEPVPDVKNGTCIITHKLSQQVRSRDTPLDSSFGHLQ